MFQQNRIPFYSILSAPFLFPILLFLLFCLQLFLFYERLEHDPASINLPSTFLHGLAFILVLSFSAAALFVQTRERSLSNIAHEKTRLLEAAIAYGKDSVVITDAQFNNDGPHIIYVNEAFTRVTGYLAEEVIGKNPKFLQGKDSDRSTLARLKECLVQGKQFSGEIKNYSKDGIAYWLDINIAPVRDSTGRITHYASVQRDVTDRKAFEKELTITKEAAEVANRAKGDFLANMSHELRTPMNGIIGLSDLLLEMNLNHEQKELGEAVNASARNLLILLNDILDLSKIEAGELTLENISFDIRRAVRQTIELMAPLASRKGVVLESTINPIVPERLMGDPGRLQQIMTNLASNAIKFTEVGYVRLDITTQRAGNREILLQMRVEDTGIGIPEDKRDIIFGKFTQADVSTARKYGGTGLGLAITKELVEMMGGRIRFDSAETKGTTFYVSIPLEVAATEQSQIYQKSAIATPRMGMNIQARVMIVDDHPVNLLFLRKVLKKMGFANVDEATGGLQALKLARKNDYDLIFMDCQMPEMDGFEASARIREVEDFSNQIKIIAVTADAMKGARERCIDAGMNDYISKPVDIEKLEAILSRWLPATQSNAPALVLPAAIATAERDTGVMDWARLSLFTDDDPAEEEALIALFTSYAEESLALLHENGTEGPNDVWKKAAHKLKGSTANLGAGKLSALCLEAENGYAASAAQKAQTLESIMVAYREVLQALDTRRARV